MENFLFYLCVFIMLAVLGYILYLRCKNSKKVNEVLYRSLGIMIFLSFFACSAIFGDDELGILGFICYAWTIVTIIILSAKLFMQEEKFWKMLIIYGLILCIFSLFHIELVVVAAVPMVVYFIYETIAKFVEDKFQEKLPLILTDWQYYHC